jgi:hypothetical protein
MRAYLPISHKDLELFVQSKSLEADEVFAPTSSFGARRALLALAAAKDYEIHQVDIKTAFLNGEWWLVASFNALDNS